MLDAPPRGPVDLVRSRFPLVSAADAAELQKHALYLDRLRDGLRLGDLDGLEIAVTFDPRAGEPNG